MGVIALEDSNFQKEVLDYKGVVVVDFYADWCGPCKMMAPIFEEAATEAKEVKFCKLNVDESRQTAAKYGVMSIPTIIIFKDGKAAKQLVGVQDKETLVKESESLK